MSPMKIEFNEGLLKGQSARRWKREFRAIDPRTARIYRMRLCQLLEHIGKTSQELLEWYSESDDDERADILGLVDDLALDWAEGLNTPLNTKTGEPYRYSGSTISNLYKAVASFFRANNRQIKFGTVRRKVAKPSDLGQGMINKHEIRKLLTLTGSYRNNTILHVMKDTGLRVSDIVQIDYHHVEEAYKKREEWLIFDLLQEKPDTVAKVALGPESLSSIYDYIEYRMKRGDTISSEAPLFTYEMNAEETRGVKVGDRMKPRAVSNTVLDICRKANLTRISAHSFRKYHEIMLIEARMQLLVIKLLQGRSVVNNTEARYFKSNNEKILEMYQEAYPHLSLENETALENRREVERLSQELEAVRDGRDREMARLHEMVRQLQKQFKEIQESLE